MLEPLSRDTLTRQATDTLRRFILAENLTAGAQLPSERELSESLSVSRNIVREALSVLVAEGLIVKQPGRGIFVTDFNREAIAPQIAVSVDYNGRNPGVLSEARAAIELGAAGLIVQRISAEQIEQLEALNGTIADLMRQRRSMIKEDIAFHKVLLEATQNQVLIGMIPILIEHFRLAVLHQPSAIMNNPERIVAEHQRIIDALRKRDLQQLRHALAVHLQLAAMEA
jgi:GntR family transcriptional repressor for pyruvate dehydrogenase complex